MSDLKNVERFNANYAGQYLGSSWVVREDDYNRALDVINSLKEALRQEKERCEIANSLRRDFESGLIMPKSVSDRLSNSVSKDEVRGLAEKAYMQGQADEMIDPCYSNAQEFANKLLTNKEEG